MAVNRAEIAVFIGPFIPDGYAIVFEIFDVCITVQKPEELMDDGTQVAFFGGNERDAFREIKAHLAAENAERSRAGAVFLFCAVFQHVLHKIEILFHGLIVRDSGGRSHALFAIYPLD